jgi:ankyrin repeat protein
MENWIFSRLHDVRDSRRTMTVTRKVISACWMVLGLFVVVNPAVAAVPTPVADAARQQDKTVLRDLLRKGADVNAPQPDGSTAIFWAAHWDDIETVELLIAAGANVSAANAYGVTPAWLACMNRNASIVAALLKAGANPNAALVTGETVLMRCAATGNVEAVKLLLASGAKVNSREARRGQTALMWAIANRHSAVAMTLIERGADVRARSGAGFTALLFAAQQGNKEIAQALLAAGAGADIEESTQLDGTALVVATASGQEELARMLLDRGANANAADSNGITALHYAVQKGLSTLTGVRYTPYGVPSRTMPALVESLLAHGADPNVRIVEDYEEFSRSLDRSPTNMVGATPFLLAAVAGDVPIMRMLLKKGADPTLPANGNATALMVAAGAARDSTGWTVEEERNALEAARLAVELGADVNAADDRGRTALHAAAFTGADSIVRFLVEKGANVNVKDKSGQTPWSMAAGICPVINGCGSYTVHESTADLLLELGATRVTIETFSQGARPAYVPAERPVETRQ